MTKYKCTGCGSEYRPIETLKKCDCGEFIKVEPYLLKTDSKNTKVLNDFSAYCANHPDERFWQALRNWVGEPFVMVGTPGGTLEDTFYREGKDK